MARLTLLRAKEALAPKAPAGKLEHRLNRVCERFLLHGKFVGSIVKLAIAAPLGQLTLPRWLLSLQGIKIDGRTRQIANRWFEFLPGPCNMDGYCLDLVRDLGDGHPIITDLPEGGNLFNLTSGTGGLTVTGRNAAGMPLVIPISANQSLANPFATIERVHKERGSFPNTLRHVSAALSISDLAPMEPTEEETYYHRYTVDGKSEIADTTVTAICKRRHIEFTNEQDVLPFSNISALELGLDALQFEAENDHATADKYLAKGVDLLNRELASTNSDNDIPTIRMKFIGGAPRFHHGY